MNFSTMKYITVLLILHFCSGCSGCEDGCANCLVISQICSRCKNGYWLLNNFCRLCPDNCELCTDNTKCSTCKANSWGIGTSCDKQCPESCGKSGCNDVTGHCFTCRPGFYGENCLKNCSLCKDGMCHRSYGQCTNGCINGYYEDTANVENKTCRKCFDNCKLCQSQGVCFECDTGFYILSYEIKPNTSVAVCSSCLPVCEECHTAINCTLCKPGMYGPICQYNCSDSHCYRCDNTENVEKCIECAAGYILNGTTCVPEVTCSLNCGNVCDENMICVGGCKEGWTGQKCTQPCAKQCQTCQQDNDKICTKCKEALFTSSCNTSCNIHCSNITFGETCSLQGGFCVNGCIGGYWGNTCNKLCNEGCNFPRCNQTDGLCASCQRNYYGYACQHRCTEHCFDDGSIHHICRKSDGKCELGCMSGYSGDRCEYPTSSKITSHPTPSNTGTQKCTCNSQLYQQNCSEAKFYVLGIVTGVGLSLLVAAGFGLFCFLRRRQKFTSVTTRTLETKEEKAYENTTIGMSALSSTETDYERLQGDKRDDQQQYTELGRPERN